MTEELQEWLDDLLRVRKRTTAEFNWTTAFVAMLQTELDDPTGDLPRRSRSAPHRPLREVADMRRQFELPFYALWTETLSKGLEIIDAAIALVEDRLADEAVED